MTPSDASVRYWWTLNSTSALSAASTCTVPSTAIKGDVITVTVTDADGNTASDSVLVTDNKAGVFELVDDQGFQEDGTARTTDTLRVSYGSDLGTPSIITWYNDGAVMSIYSLANGNLTQWAFNSDNCRSKNPVYDAAGVLTGYTELADGEWMVTIENTDGELWTSNTVEVVFEGQAVMSDVSIEDDYETSTALVPMNVELTKTTGSAILNVTFNKNYSGTLYLIDSKIEKGIDGHDGNAVAMDGSVNNAAGDPINSIEKALTKVSTRAQLTNKKATAAYDGVSSWGIYYEDSTGAVHCKFVVDLGGGETVTRGSSYYLVWDQDDVDGDEITATATKDDLNTSDDMVVPYVKAPASIVVSSFATDSDTVKVDALDENGDKLAWYTDETDGVANQGLDSAKIFKVDTNAKSSSDSSENADTTAVKKGTYTFTTAADIPNAYVYVKLVTKAGVFAKDSITLESDLSESARDAMTSMSMKEDDSDPTAAVVEFKGLSTKAPGKVYIMQGNLATEALVNSGTDADKAAAAQADAYALIAKHDLTDAIAEAAVEGGAASVKIAGVFEADDMANPNAAQADTYGKDMGNDAFVAIYVPDDTELWKSASNLAEDDNGNLLGYRLEPTITTIDKSELTAALTAQTAALSTITVGGIQAMDQFGNKWVGTGNNNNAASVSMINKTATNEEDKAEITNGYVTISNGGVISFVAAIKGGKVNNDKFDKGDGFDVKVPGLKDLKITFTAKDNLVFKAGALQVGATAGADHSVAVGATLTTADPNATGTGDLKLSSAFSIG